MGGAPSLQVHRTKGWGLFQVFLHLTTKECPCMFVTTQRPQSIILLKLTAKLLEEQQYTTKLSAFEVAVLNCMQPVTQNGNM